METLNPIAVLVRNERGVLARVAGLFARRGFNIVSLAVGETENPRVSRISVVVGGDEPTRQQVVKQLERLVSVIRVQDLSHTPRVERGLALVKVRATPENRDQIIQLANVFRARICHIDHLSMIVEVAGDREKVSALIDLLKPHGILEMARTGQIVLSRHTLLEDEPELAARRPSSPGAGIYNLTPKEQGELS
jgi:acetolactate synthase-1/3 small subunit